MIELATQHNIVTPFTSLVACVPGTGATDTTMQLHIIDNNKTEAPATNTTSTTTTATTTKARKTKKRVQKQQSSPSSSAGLQAGQYIFVFVFFLGLGECGVCEWVVERVRVER